MSEQSRSSSKSKKPVHVPPELDDVANQIGEFIEYWGFKKIHGRIWVTIFVSELPLDASDLIERLGVSKALVSMSIADLIEYDVIQISGKNHRGNNCYCSNPNLLGVILNVLRKRERRMLARLSSATRLLESLPQELNAKRELSISAKRIGLLDEMVRTAESALDAFLQLQPAHFESFRKFSEIENPATHSPN